MKSKTVETIMEELGELGELYALPKTLEGYSNVTGRNDANGVQYRAMAANKDIHNLLNYSIRSLLEGIVDECKDKMKNASFYDDERKILVSPLVPSAFDAGVTMCIGVIQSALGSTKQ